MSRIYVHIGAEKCGSSLIEYSLLSYKPMRDALEKFGITALAQFHVALRNVVLGTQWDDSLHGRLRAQMLTPHRMSGKTVFMSEELLLSLVHEPGQENPLDLRIAFTKKLLEGFDEIKIILVVRRQDKFIESHYNQQVKRGETRPFAEVFKDLPLDNYCWDVIADAWEEGFGEGNITLLPFETSVLATAPGGPQNTVAAICNLMGAHIAVETRHLPIVNPSLRPDLLPAMCEINSKLDRKSADMVADIFARNVRKVPGAAQGLFSKEDRQALLDRYAESNKRLFSKYIPQCSVGEYLTMSDGE